MPRLAALFLALSTATASAQAACSGTDLFTTMPAEELAALHDTAAEAPHPEGILWRAEKDGRVLHLVGTMHLHDPRHQVTLDRVTPMIEDADTVFLELGAGDEARLQRMIAEDPALAFITEGPTLPDLLEPEVWNDLKAAMAERGMPGFMVAKMKPWMAMANLGMTRCDMENIQKGLRGLDAMISELAIDLGKPPVALEPVDTALKLFSEYTQEEQLELLRLSLLQQTENSADMSVTVAEAYFREEIQVIWEFTMALSRQMSDLSPEELEAEIAKLEELLIVRRNAAWMDLILGSDTDDVIAVGALHMPGRAGLLSLLEEAGFTVTRLSLTE